MTYFLQKWQFKNSTQNLFFLHHYQYKNKIILTPAGTESEESLSLA
jgi:hypothetical protein